MIAIQISPQEEEEYDASGVELAHWSERGKNQQPQTKSRLMYLLQDQDDESGRFVKDGMTFRKRLW